jgi:ADP-L-glycero-D-manno-heptose 6-epimerase
VIVVTGAGGFIGSALVWALNQRGITDILVVDSLDHPEKQANVDALHCERVVDKQTFINTLDDLSGVEAVFHMGACSSTMETDARYLQENNTDYTERLARWCLAHNARFIYASSAATYGDGEQGYDDDVATLDSLRPLNLYGKSKHDFDIIARDNGWLDKIAGFKFFNVFGPNEYHKGRMASVVLHALPQAQAGEVKLFKSYKEGFEDGWQLRDFVYVKDVVAVMLHFFDNPQVNGLFNLGTGEARSFYDLAAAVFTALGKEPNISYIEMPEALRDKYQYYTCAEMRRLREAGYTAPFTSLEDAVREYVTEYLVEGRHLSA